MQPLRSIEAVREQLVPESRRAGAPDVIELVAECGALLEGHFSLQSGRHSPYFLRFAQIGRNRAAIATVAQSLLDELGNVRFDVVLCPESGGYVLGQAIAARTETELVVSAINSLRRPTANLRRGPVPSGSSVLIVNDVVTTGSSLEPLLSATISAGATLAGIATFASLRPQDFARFRNAHGLAGAHLVSAAWKTYAPAECPLCHTRESLVPAAEFN